MIEFRVNDMTCGHCEASVRKAVASVAPAAHTQVSLAEHRVSIDGTSDSAAALEQAIRSAGFTPQPWAPQA
jgi:copper chaperone